MRVGYNTNGLAHHRLEDGLRLLADHGYQAVALTPDVPHLDPFTASATEVGRIAALLERLGLAVVIETGAPVSVAPASGARG
jgi:sugar phosphate isomerase/epimerase